MFQHIDDYLTPHYCDGSPFAATRNTRLRAEESAPLKLPTRHCSLWFFPLRLDTNILKTGISLAAPLFPKEKLQSLPAMLRIKTLEPISSCSKAPGVFSSRCRYPASLQELHFHRARPRDSSPVVTPFVRFGNYPKRNCATLERL